MIREGSIVTIGDENRVFKVMSVDKADKSEDGSDYDMVWLMWVDKNYPDNYGLALYDSCFRKELNEIVE